MSAPVILATPDFEDAAAEVAPVKAIVPNPSYARISAQPAFVLHQYPYKETSLIVEFFTRDYGRIALIAKGAKRPYSALRSVLQTFQPLNINWSGKSELRTLTAAEWVGGLPALEKEALLCGFYLNELLIKLLAREDAHAALFEIYVETLAQLTQTDDRSASLRKFERGLLKETGVATNFEICSVSGQPVVQDEWYVVDPERGPRPAVASDSWPRVSGKTLLALGQAHRHDELEERDAAIQQQSKALMRFLLAHHLNGEVLNTRQILRDLQKL